MPRLSYRRMFHRQMQMFNMTGKCITIYVQTSGPDTPPDVPDDVFTGTEAPNESGLTKKYIWASFEESDNDQFTEIGKLRSVSGIITIPMLWKTDWANTKLIDPYGDGSRFVKDGPVQIDEGRFMIVQRINAIKLSSVGEVSG